MSTTNVRLFLVAILLAMVTPIHADDSGGSKQTRATVATDTSPDVENIDEQAPSDEEEEDEEDEEPDC